jgi:hypothetical protein
MSEQLNEALSQFRVSGGNTSALPSEARPELVGAGAGMARR